MLICKISLRKFIHEITSIIPFDCRDNSSDIQQNSTCKAGSAEKRKMHVELARLHLQQFFYLTTHLLNASLKRKTDNISIILRRILQQRAVGMLQQYVSITLPVCIGHRSLNTGVRNAWQPEIDEFSLVCRKLRHLSAGDRYL